VLLYQFPFSQHLVLEAARLVCDGDRNKRPLAEGLQRRSYKGNVDGRYDAVDNELNSEGSEEDAADAGEDVGTGLTEYLHYALGVT
jgi:hypothetical protein